MDISDLRHDTNEIICMIKMGVWYTNTVFKRFCGFCVEVWVESPLAAFSSKSRNPGDPDCVLRQFF